MERVISIKEEYNTLDSLLNYLKSTTIYDCSIGHDKWEVRKDANGQLEKCIIIKKSAMHGVKVYFIEENSIQIIYTIPNMLLHAYFGKSQKAYRKISEIVLGKIRDLILVGFQKKAFEEINQSFDKIIAKQ